jgi:hypothetical protein
MKHLLRNTLILTVAFLTASATSLVQAQSLGGTHPDINGDTIDFTNIVELDVSTDPISALFFGPGVAVGDMALFAPPANFNSLSTDRDLEFKDGRLSMRVTSNDGSLFSGITIDEFGAYNVLGDAAARVDLVGSVVTEDGIFTDSASFQQVGPGQGDWEFAASFVFPATDEAVLVIDNQLLTVAAEGVDNFAFIDKKVVKITTVPAIPEPGSLSLFGLGCIGLVARRRRA